MADDGVANVLEDFLPAPYPAPLFAAGAQHLDFGEVRRPAQKRLTFKVSNIGGAGNLQVTLTPNIPNQQWFRVRPSVVVIPAGEDCIVDVDIDTSQESCPLGRHDLDIQFEAPASMVEEIPRVRVTVEVLPEIKLACDPGVVEFGEVPLGESHTVSVSVARTDEQKCDLNERLVELVDDTGTRRPAWADVKIGPPDHQQTVDITFHTANRAMREYRCELRLADIHSEVNPVEVPVHVAVGPPPELQLKWAIEPLPIFTGDSQEAQMAVGNSGGGVLRGRITGDQFWLRVQSGEFNVPAGDAKWVPVRIGDSRLQAGEYRGQLEVFSNDGGRSRVRRIPIHLEVEGEDACPVEIVLETDLGQLTRGQKGERALTVRNRMARPFEGKVISGSPEWLSVQAGSETVRLGPGEMKQVVLEVNTRPLPASERTVPHTATLQLVDSGGRERWKDTATLKLLPPPKSILPKLAAALAGLLLLALLAFAAMKVIDRRPQAASTTRPATTSPGTGSSPATKAGPGTTGAAGLAPGGAGTPAAGGGKKSAPSAGAGTRPLPPDPAKARALYAKGLERFKQKQWKEAADLFGRAARVDPNPAGCYVMAGRSRYQLRQWDAAAKALKAAVEAKPDSASAHLWLGRVYAKQGSPGAARREFEAAQEADPNDRQAQDELSKLQ